MIELFEPFLGQWTGVEKHTLLAGAEAGSARAMMVFRLDLAGTAVLQDYRRVRDDGVEWTAHGVFLITDPPGGLSWWRFASGGEPPEPVTGAWRDGGLEFSTRTTSGIAWHSFRIDSAGRLILRIEQRAADGAEYAHVMVGAYERISGH